MPNGPGGGVIVSGVFDDNCIHKVFVAGFYREAAAPGFVGAMKRDCDLSIRGFFEQFDLGVGARGAVIDDVDNHAVGQVIGIGVGDGDDFSFQAGEAVGACAITDGNQGFGKSRIAFDEVLLGEVTGGVGVIQACEIFVVDEFYELFPFGIAQGAGAGFVDDNDQTVSVAGDVKRRRIAHARRHGRVAVGGDHIKPF